MTNMAAVAPEPDTDGNEVPNGADTAAEKDAALESIQHEYTGLQAFQWKIWILLDDPSSSKEARATSIFMMIVIAVSVICFCAASVPTNADYEWTWDKDQGCWPCVVYKCDEVKDDDPYYYMIETVCIIVFTAEYFIRLFCAPVAMSRFSFIRAPANLVDFIAIIPFYIDLANQMQQDEGGGGNVDFLAVLRVVRLSRVLRILKVSRNFQGVIILINTMRKSGPALAMLVFFVILSMVLFSTLIYFAERGEYYELYEEGRGAYLREDGSVSPYESIPVSFWWCLVTMTTVGYGDVTPVTSGGQIVAITCMLCGVLLLSLPITIIGANFDEEYREMRRSKEQDDITKKQADEAILAEDKSDPLSQIQILINESHAQLVQDIERLMETQEEQLRAQIRQILADAVNAEATLNKEAGVGDEGEPPPPSVLEEKRP